MALGNRKSSDIFNKNTGANADAKSITDSKELEIKADFEAGVHVADEGMFNNMAPALYAVQQVAEDIEELRRFVGAEVDATPSWVASSDPNYATQAYVQSQVSGLVDSAPSTLNTLNELAAALGDDANFSTTVTNNIATKLAKTGGTMTGALTIETNSDAILNLKQTDAGSTSGTKEGGWSYIQFLDGQGDRQAYFGVDNNGDIKIAPEVPSRVVSVTAGLSVSGNLAISGTVDGVDIGANYANWNTAYGWGNHASAGYLTSSSTQSKYLRSDATDTWTGKLAWAGTDYADGIHMSLGNIRDVHKIDANEYFQRASGRARNNLGDPTVTEMALFEEQFKPQTTLANDYDDLTDLTFWSQETSSSDWVEVTSYSDDQKRRFLRTNNSSIIIPNTYYKFRVEFKARAYTFANAMYMYWSSQSHRSQVHVWKKRCSDGTWFQHTSATNTISSWPGHGWVPFSKIPWHETSTTSTGHFTHIRVEFIPTWTPYSGSGTDYSTRNINIYGMQIWGGYPSGRRTPHYYDQNGEFNFLKDAHLQDGKFLKLGTGDDLKLYHDGSNSYIKDGGTGSLYTLTNAYRLTNAAGNENMIWAEENSFVKLYHNNSAKLETASGGVNVTGNLAVSGTVDGATLYGNHPDGNGSSLKLGRADNSNYWRFNHAGNDLRIYNEASSGSDILLGVDASGNAKANNVGIGTASPSATLHISDASNSGVTSLSVNNRVKVRGDGVVQWGSAANNGFLSWDTNQARVGALSGSHLAIFSNGSEKMRIDTSGNVGIGTTSPAYKLDVNGTSRIQGTVHMYGSVRNYSGDFSLQNGHQDSDILFKVNDGGTTTTAMMIDGATSNVGIGTTSPSTKLHIEDSSHVYSTLQSTGANTEVAHKYRSSTLTSGYYWWTGLNNYDKYQIAYGTSFDNAGTALCIDTSGNVGIGTTSPDRKLEVDFTGSVTGAKFTRSDAAGSSLVEFANSAGVKNIIGYDAGLDGYKIGTSSATNLLVKQSGNVGIGTSSPSSLLHIEGSAPKIQFTDTTTSASSYIDADSGFGSLNIMADQGNSVASSQINLLVDGSSKMVIKDTGNVGIGTTNPTAKLEVSAGGTTSQEIAHFGNSNGVGKIKMQLDSVGSSKQVMLDASNNEDIVLSAQGDSYINSGNVGIGTSSPAYKLSVNGDVQSDFFRGYQYPTGSYLDFDDDTTPGSNGTALVSISSMKFMVDSNNNGTADAFSWIVDGLPGSGTTLMTLLDEGNLGIGTTSPSEKLEVDGNIAVSGTVDGVDIAAQANAVTANTAKRDARYIYVPVVCNFYGDLSTGEYHVPFSDGETESTSTTNRRNQFVAPCDGHFHKVIVRSNNSTLERGSATDLTIKSKKVVAGTASVTTLETKVVDTVAAETKMVTTFDSTNSAFDEGDRLLLSMQLTDGFPRGSKSYFVTVVFKVDQSDLD